MAADSNPEDDKTEIEKNEAPEAGKAEMSATPASAADERTEPKMDAKPEPKFEGKADPKIEAKAPEAKADGKALAPAGAGPVNPFLGIAPDEKVESVIPPRGFVSRALDYSAHAAIIVGLIGFAWTVSDHVVSHPAKTDAPEAAAAAMAPAAPQKPDEMTELRLANMKMHDEIRTLKANVDALRTAARRDTTPEQVRVLSATIDNLKGSIGASKSETKDAIAQLQGKVDKLQPGKFQALSERVGRLEHQTIDTASTASIPKSEPHREIAKAEPADSTRAAPKPPTKPASLAAAEEKAADENKPQIISAWVVRDVYEGVALIEGKRGNTLEVVPGVSIPGAGVVKSIDRKGNGWTITTSKGQLAFAGREQQHEQTARDYRRGPYRGGYGGGYGGGYRYDY